jgi:hypothetical protein
MFVSTCRRPFGIIAKGPARLDFSASGLEHFGLEVVDVEKGSARLREKYPSVQLIKRPTNRPFAGISTHDPEDYVFDLSQQDMNIPPEVHVEGRMETGPPCEHFVLRALNPANLAKFDRDIYELQELEKAAAHPSHLSHRWQRTLVVSPWAITDYEGIP